MARILGKRWVWGPLLSLSVLCALLIFRQAHHAMELSDPERARSHGRPIPVRTARVGEAEYEQVIGATALTAPSMEAVVRPASPSRGQNTTDVIVGSVHVREGDRVRRGQLLFEVLDEVRLDDVRRAEAAMAAAYSELGRVKKSVSFAQHTRELDLASALSNLQFRKEDLDNRRQMYDAVSKLRKDRAVSGFEYFDARSKYAMARFELSEAERGVQKARNAVAIGALQDQADLARATSGVETARTELDGARLDLRWCQLRSPIDGFIENKIDFAAGQVLAVTTPLARVVETDPLHIRVDFPQERMDEIAVGQEAEIVLDSFPKETFHGKVLRVSPLVNPQLRVFPVVVEMSNPGHRVKKGVSGFVRIRRKRKTTGVPTAAVIQHGSKAMVFCVEDGRAHLREVQVEHPLEHGIVEVKSGLKAGEEVVVYFSNFYRHWRELSSRECYLQDNDPVDVDWRRWARRD